MVYLALTLPRRYEARHWSVVWVGFDIVECVVLASLAFLTWKRRQLMVFTAVMAGTLLLSDAWFDVISSWGNGDSWSALVLAIFVELPASAFLFWVAYRNIRRTLAAYDALLGRPDHSGNLLRVPALSPPFESDPTSGEAVQGHMALWNPDEIVRPELNETNHREVA